MKVRLIALWLPLFMVSVVSAQASKNAAPAQPQFSPLTGGELKVDDKQIPAQRETSMVARFASSNDVDAKPQTDADRAAIDKVIKYDLYRLTWESVITVRDPARYGTIPSIMSELLGNELDNVHSKVFPPIPRSAAQDQEETDKRMRQKAYVQILAPSVVQHARAVLQNKEISARINATRVLARLAEWGREEAVDDLVRVIKNPQESDAVRVHAFQGLEAIFALTESNDLRANGLFATQAGQERFRSAVAAVLAWLEAHTNMTNVQLVYLSKEEIAAIAYIRRAAERALGAAKYPLLVDNRNEGKQVGKIADLLARIVAGDASISPTPDMRERIDAAQALCQLRASHSPSYQADYAAGVLARFLADLGSFCNQQNHGYLGWQNEADRMNRALTTFATQHGTAYAKSVLAAAKPLLEHFDDANKNPTAVETFANWVSNNQPSSKEVYKPLGQ
jgi:hypothetical protein